MLDAPNRKKPKANSRVKGAAFERTVAQELFLLTGVTFKRDLEQVRAADHGDLLADVPEWPFVLECKRYSDGWDCRDAWRDQAAKAAAAVKLIPAVVFQYDRKPIRVSVPYYAIASAIGLPDPPDEWVNLTLPGFAHLAQELMAAQALARADE